MVINDFIKHVPRVCLLCCCQSQQIFVFKTNPWVNRAVFTSRSVKWKIFLSTVLELLIMIIFPCFVLLVCFPEAGFHLKPINQRWHLAQMYLFAWHQSIELILNTCTMEKKNKKNSLKCQEEATVDKNMEVMMKMGPGHLRRGGGTTQHPSLQSHSSAHMGGRIMSEESVIDWVVWGQSLIGWVIHVEIEYLIPVAVAWCIYSFPHFYSRRPPWILWMTTQLQ